MRRQILQSLFVFILIFNLNQSNNASSGINLASGFGGKCKAPGTPVAAMAGATAVFLGKITKISEADNTKTIEFEVEEFWKGKQRKTQTISVSIGMRYSPSFKVGERYLVYAAGSDEKLSTGRCSRTKLVEYADDDLKALGAGEKP